VVCSFRGHCSLLPHLPSPTQEGAANAVVGTFSTTDPDAGATFTYSLLSNPSNLFSVVGNQLRTATAISFASFPSVTIQVGVVWCFEPWACPLPPCPSGTTPRPFVFPPLPEHPLSRTGFGARPGHVDAVGRIHYCG
jgi:hypothetical protein